MKIGIPKEIRDSEPRVAASPETVKKLIGLGYEVMVEKGAGAGSFVADDAFADAGATIAADAYSEADIVLKVQGPSDAEIGKLKKGAVLAAIMAPHENAAALKQLAAGGVTSFAMELVPRITRAQAMDVLSSQANLAGYKAVIDAAAHFGRAMPMMMTAAGTIAPAKVFVMGAGVAGLQAIATARRLGAVVNATDVRPAAKEQVESLGASFVMVENEETKAAETSGGYAKEMSDDYKRQQADLISKTIAKQDIVICTAQIPGRKAPVLVTQEMVETMKPGSVIVDLAVEQGGNCPLSEVGKIVDHNGVAIMGFANVPGRLAVDASSLYAKNMLNFIANITDEESGVLKIDFEDEIVSGSALTHEGKVVHPQFTDAAPAPKPVEVKSEDNPAEAKSDEGGEG